MKINDISVLKAQLEEASKNVAVDSVTKTNLGDSRVRDYEERVISEWKKEKVKAVRIAEFDTAKDLIKVTLNGLSTATLISGEGGIGKTFLTIETVKEELKPDEWVYKSGFTSPLAFYKFLYRNRNTKVIIVDDVEGLFNNSVSLAIMKRATHDTTGKRLIYYDTTSNKAEGTPAVFELKSRLIILCNKVPNWNEPNMTAFLSRTIHYKLEFSHEQKKEIIRQILSIRKDLSKEQKQRVLEIIDKETTIATKNFNIRTMEKLTAYVKYNPQKAETLFRETTDKDDDEELVMQLMISDFTAERQADKFYKATGKSRRTYFRIKKRIAQKSKTDTQESAKVTPKKDVTNGTHK